ncbi:hypothetical protein EVAR_32071_1 [Eumeta japonica]|uniref:Uncharacterized protein n=1 Tax=Eumeta variegata TaxID=151549 RepID=A0A4C1WQX6_EUMVA|nr:hypothetical protein EVAR_32071_1 [Eumeta japonica]
MVLCLNHAVHLAVLESFCKKNETNENFTSNQDSDNLSGEESEYDEDNCDLEPEIRTNYTQNIDKALQDTRALVKLFRKSSFKNITLQKHVKEEFGHELAL